MVECIGCRRIVQRDEGKAPLWDCIYRTDYCDVVHCDDTSLLGWLIIIPRRHIGAVDEMTEGEALEVGRLIRSVSLAIKEVTGCEKTYVVQFAESPGHQHVHFHIIPRATDLPEDQRGLNVFKYKSVPPEDRLSEAIMNDFVTQFLSYFRKADSF